MSYDIQIGALSNKASGWGALLRTTLTAAQTALNELDAGKAAISHTHTPSGVIVVEAGTAASRASQSPTSALLWLETDTGLTWLYDGEDPYDSGHWFCMGIATGSIFQSGDAGKRLIVNGDEDGFVLGSTPAMIPLTNWQTSQSEYTVEKQNIANANGHGADSFYRYVFTEAIDFGVMYTAIPVPFAGYDLQLNTSYRMSTSVSGDVLWKLAYKAVSAGDTIAEYADWAAFDAADDATLSFTDTPSATANVISAIGGTDLVIPATAYNEGDILLLALIRDSDDALDTHTGDAQVSDTIFLKPVLA